jgi:hypothetical protein
VNAVQPFVLVSPVANENHPLPFVKVLSKFRFWKNLFIFFTGKGLFFHEMSAIPSDS